MKVSNNCFKLITSHTRLKLVPYFDHVGIPRVGYESTHYMDGSTIKVGDDSITEEMANEMLTRDIENAAQFVNEHVTVRLSQDQFDALVSIAQSIQPEDFAKSVALSKLNDNCFQCATNQFPSLCYRYGKSIPELITRRVAERQLFWGQWSPNT